MFDIIMTGKSHLNLIIYSSFRKECEIMKAVWCLTPSDATFIVIKLALSLGG